MELHNTTSVSHGQWETLISQTWVSGNWQNQSKTTYSYDGGNHQISALSQSWNTGSGTWVNSALSTNTLNPDGTTEYTINQSWNASNSTWQNSSKAIFTYTGFGRWSTYTAQTWVSGNWQNSSLSTYTYDGNNFLTLDGSQSWSTATSQWTTGGQNLYTNYPDGNVNYTISQSWNSTNSTWQNSGKQTFTYNTTGIDEQVADLVSLYPNPATNFIKLSLTDPNTPYQISLTDINGKLLQVEHSTGSNPAFDVSTLASGVYVITVTQGNKTATQRFVKE